MQIIYISSVKERYLNIDIGNDSDIIYSKI